MQTGRRRRGGRGKREHALMRVDEGQVRPSGGQRPRVVLVRLFGIVLLHVDDQLQLPRVTQTVVPLIDV